MEGKAVEGNPKPLLDEAYSLHRAGRLTEADTIYERILKTHPDHADAIYLKG